MFVWLSSFCIVCRLLFDCSMCVVNEWCNMCGWMLVGMLVVSVVCFMCLCMMFGDIWLLCIDMNSGCGLCFMNLLCIVSYVFSVLIVLWLIGILCFLLFLLCMVILVLVRLS